MTLKATDAMRSAVERLIEAKRISLTAYQHAVANGYTDAEVIGLAERNRRLKAQIEINGSPTRYRQAEAISNPNDPTPQRQVKAGKALKGHTVGRGAMVPVKAYRVRSIVDQYGDKFGLDHRTALARFMQDANYAERVRVANHNSSGGGKDGDSLGGLGNVPQHVRDGNARNDWIWQRLPRDLQKTAMALVLGTLAKPDGTAFSMEDFGASIFPSVIDKNRRWGAAAGALWALAGTLAALYGHCPVVVRRIDESERVLEAVGDRNEV